MANNTQLPVNHDPGIPYSVAKLLNNPRWLANIDFDGVSYHVTPLTVNVGTKAYEILLGLESGDYDLKSRDIFAVRDLILPFVHKISRQVTIGTSTDFIIYEAQLITNRDRKIMIACRPVVAELISFDASKIDMILARLKEDFPFIF